MKKQTPKKLVIIKKGAYGVRLDGRWCCYAAQYVRGG